jgi:hypothetical protein
VLLSFALWSGNAFAYAAPDLEQGSRWLIQHNQVRPASERLVLNLLPTLQRSIDAGRAAGTPLSEMVRTRRFAERVWREVLGVTDR